jgi:hypothetical protein
MKNAKRLVLFITATFVLAIPFVRVDQMHAMPNANHAQMSLSSSDCMSQCTNASQLPSASGVLNLQEKEKEREPSPPPPYWQLFQPVSLTALYLLLSTIFLFLIYKDPKIIRSTQLRF